MRKLTISNGKQGRVYQDNKFHETGRSLCARVWIYLPNSKISFFLSFKICLFLPFLESTR